MVGQLQNAAPDVAERNFSLRIVSHDFYLTQPSFAFDPVYTPLTKKPLKTVPLVRIYGPTPDGQTCCAHVHGFFPSFYVMMPDSLFFDLRTGKLSNGKSLPESDMELVLRSQLRIMAETFDALLFREIKASKSIGAQQIALQQQNVPVSFDFGRSEAGMSKRQPAPPYVYDLQVVWRRNFYGFHAKPQRFLKITCTSPHYVHKVRMNNFAGFFWSLSRRKRNEAFGQLLEKINMYSDFLFSNDGMCVVYVLFVDGCVVLGV
jgi:hypothetical protein